MTKDYAAIKGVFAQLFPLGNGNDTDVILLD